jgi:hypothetical protein
MATTRYHRKCKKDCDDAEGNREAEHEFTAMSERMCESFTQKYQQAQAVSAEQHSDQQRRHHRTVEDALEGNMKACRSHAPRSERRHDRGCD